MKRNEERYSKAGLLLSKIPSLHFDNPRAKLIVSSPSSERRGNERGREGMREGGREGGRARRGGRGGMGGWNRMGCDGMGGMGGDIPVI